MKSTTFLALVVSMTSAPWAVKAGELDREIFVDLDSEIDALFAESYVEAFAAEDPSDPDDSATVVDTVDPDSSAAEVAAWEAEIFGPAPAPEAVADPQPHVAPVHFPPGSALARLVSAGETLGLELEIDTLLGQTQWASQVAALPRSVRSSPSVAIDAGQVDVVLEEMASGARTWQLPVRDEDEVAAVEGATEAAGAPWQVLSEMVAKRAKACWDGAVTRGAQQDRLEVSVTVSNRTPTVAVSGSAASNDLIHCLAPTLATAVQGIEFAQDGQVVLPLRLVAPQN